MSDPTLLLQQIADHTATDNSVWVAAISAGAAILGGLISALLSYFITRRSVKSQAKLEKRRLRANVITTERLRWLQDIRNRISDLYAQMDMQYVVIKQPIDPTDLPKLQSQINNYSSEIMQQVNMVTLMLNPEKEDQNTLREELQKSLAFMQSCFLQTTSSAQAFDDENYKNIKTEIFRLTTIIGTQTWKRIKQLK